VAASAPDGDDIVGIGCGFFFFGRLAVAVFLLGDGFKPPPPTPPRPPSPAAP